MKCRAPLPDPLTHYILYKPKASLHKASKDLMSFSINEAPNPHGFNLYSSSNFSFSQLHDPSSIIYKKKPKTMNATFVDSKAPNVSTRKKPGSTSLLMQIISTSKISKPCKKIKNVTRKAPKYTYYVSPLVMALEGDSAERSQNSLRIAHYREMIRTFVHLSKEKELMGLHMLLVCLKFLKMIHSCIWFLNTLTREIWFNILKKNLYSKKMN